MDLAFSANQALLLNRDDIAARVSGPIRIRSDAKGGSISGKLRLDNGHFQLGRASPARRSRSSMSSIATSTPTK